MARFTLRPQQCIFEDSIRNAFRKHRRVLGVAATGFGKSVVMADMAFKAVYGKGRHVLAVTNRRAVVIQLTEQCQNAGIQTGIIMGDMKRDDAAPMQIASIQTLQRRGYETVTPPTFLVIDEAHQFSSEYRKLICDRFPNVPVLGLTATPVGPGGTRIGHFDVMVEPIKNSEAIAAGHLLPVDPYRAPWEPDLEGVNLKKISQDELGNRVEACTVYGDVFAEWEPYSHMQTMVVLPSRAVCNQFHKMAVSRGITAKIVDGTTAQSDRDDTFSEFKATDCQMLLGVDVVREGLDLPIAQCLIDLQPTHQFRVYFQKLGRIKRPHPGQKSAVVIDLAGNLWRHMVHPNQDPPWDELTSDNTIEGIISAKAGRKCKKCGSEQIFKGVCQDCGEKCTPEKQPWVCPRCSFALPPGEKIVSGMCPSCGDPINRTPIRRISMGNGRMRSVSIKEVSTRKKAKASSEQQAWDRWLHICLHTRRKLSWARAMYKKETGKWPNPDRLKNCPEVDSGDWRLKPDDIWPWKKKLLKKV